MLVYPQLASGALTQFPVRKKRALRTIVNTLADGTSIKLADPSGELTEWQLQYADLSDLEAAALQLFFETVEGSLHSFTFLDPVSNLLAWSDRLDHAEWSPGPLLSITGGIADHMGGTNAWRLFNNGAAAQGLSQTLEAPGAYLFCLSLYAKAAAGTIVTLLRGTARAERLLGQDWRRITFAASGDAAAEAIEFGIELPPGESVDVFGMQVEPQAAASAYKPSTMGGVYSNTWFRDDFLNLTATDVNRHSATVSIIHGNRL